MYAINLSRQAAAFMESLPAKQAWQIAERLQSLANDPQALPSELLKGYSPMRRLRAGEYRIIYTVDEQTLQVRLIGKRNDDDIYKALERGFKK
jgi:mRNA interferase RelE/StbE